MNDAMKSLRGDGALDEDLNFPQSINSHPKLEMNATKGSTVVENPKKAGNYCGKHWGVPVHKVMGKVLGELIGRSYSKDMPCGSQGRVHGWACCWKGIDNYQQHRRGQHLLEKTMIVSKVEMPARKVNDQH